MSYFRIALVIGLFMLTLGQARAGEMLRIATEGAYPPFNDLDESGQLVGFDVDIAKALCQAMNVECTLLIVPWEDMLPKLNANAFDVIIASMARTEERAKHADFTNYYYRSRTMFIADPSMPFIQTRDGLKGKVIAAQAGTIPEEYLLREYRDSVIVKPTETNGEAFDLLASRAVDAVLADSLTSFEFLQTDQGAPFDFVGNPLPASDPSSEARIAVRKGETELVERLNQAIIDIRFNGQYEKINRKYFPFSIY